jgi:hypothetical protein
LNSLLVAFAHPATFFHSKETALRTAPSLAGKPALFNGASTGAESHIASSYDRTWQSEVETTVLRTMFMP